ncbi:MAG: hypothetical protein ACKOW8_12785 [Flavobacteriales bacterium]
MHTHRRYFFEINHPGQVHLLRNLYFDLISKGHFVIVGCKEEKIITDLLTHYKIPFYKLGKKGNGKWGKLFKQVVFDFRALLLILRHRCNMGVGSSMTNDHVSAILPWFRAIHLSDDDETAVPLIAKFSYPFAHKILAPQCIKIPSFEKKLVRYPSYHELAYLHPARFQPDPSVLQRAHLKESETYFVLRFVALKGHHDDGHLGLSFERKKILIEFLQTKGKVFITSEKPIEPEFEHLRLPIPPQDIHSFLYFAAGFAGDSQTMTTEAALLGTPSFKCNTFARELSIPNEIEDDYQLCFSYQPKSFEAFFNHIQSTFSDMKNIKKLWQEKRERLINDKIDLTQYLSDYLTSI